MRKIAILNMLFVCLTLAAQTEKINISLALTDGVEGCKMYIKPLSTVEKTDMIEMTAENGMFKTQINPSNTELYEMVCVKERMQIITPIHICKGATENIKTSIKDNILVIDDCNDNRALSAYTKALRDCNRALWNIQSPDTLATKRLLISFQTKADSILNTYKCTPDVEKYIRMWAYTSTYSAYFSLPRILKCSPKDMPIKSSAVMARPETMLDTPMSLLFTITPTLVGNYMPREKSITEQLNWLYGSFKCKKIVDSVADAALNKYIARYDYAGNFDAGLAELKALTEKYQLSNKYIKTFVANKATVKGNPFPTDVVFKDVNGNVVTIEQFKGKYIYLDVWASWCVPCCREVPHLQRLERELQNPNVVFLSISVDAKTEPWKKKMTALNMHGNQWHDANAKLSKALNVRGIPFFAIYDKEGKLYMYNAPRPSHPQLKNLLEELK